MTVSYIVRCHIHTEIPVEYDWDSITIKTKHKHPMIHCIHVDYVEAGWTVFDSSEEMEEEE